MFHGIRGGHHGRHCGPRGGSRHWGPFEVRWEFDPEATRGGRGGGRRRMFDGGELRLVILALIAQKPRHGYEVIKALGERVGGEYSPSPGVVYPTLTLLEDMGYAVHVGDAESAAHAAYASMHTTEAAAKKRKTAKAA